MLLCWRPKVTAVIHQQGSVWMCTISSSCTEYVIVSKHPWIVTAPWLRPSPPINSSFIPLICRTAVFHSDRLAWIFMSVLFFSPTHHCSLFTSLKSTASVTHMAETTYVTGLLSTLKNRTTVPPSGKIHLFLKFISLTRKKKRLSSAWLLCCFKSQCANPAPLICWVFSEQGCVFKAVSGWAG